MPTRRALLRGLIAGGVVGVGTRGTHLHAAVTADDQRRWTGIVREWDPGGSCVLTQVNQMLADQFPEEWTQPYRGFIYGFSGMIPGPGAPGVCGQWKAAHQEKEIYLHASVPGKIVGRYTLGDNFNIENQFPKETLRTAAGFAELWAAVQASQARILHAIDQIVET